MICQAIPRSHPLLHDSCNGKRHPASLAGLLFACLGWMAIATGARAESGVVVRSPDGNAVIEVQVTAKGKLLWQASFRGRQVLQPAPLGLRFAGESEPQAVEVAGVRRSAHDATVEGLIGKASSARDHHAEAVISLAPRDAAGRPLELVLRAYDDGVAYRWRIPGEAGFTLAGEASAFGLPAKTRAWVMPVGGFENPYEEYYLHGPLAGSVAPGQLVALPLLFEDGAGGWGALTEAALSDWAGLYLTRQDDALFTRLSPHPGEPAIAVVQDAGGAHLSPWRVVMLGDSPGRLLESNLVALLNPPPAAGDWSWVRPGKTSFPWWNDYAWPGAPFEPGLNTATMLAYIDFCADNGIPYHSLDGVGDQAWYGGPITPDGTAQDLTHATPAIDMPAVLAHAKARGVRLRLWTHWQPLRAQLDLALATWAGWGVEGIMVDFMNRDDQEMVRFHEEVVRKAAAHHLTVTFHGTYKPTGEGRTWPNLLTREAVRGLEFDKFDGNPGSTPEHETTIPFTRMLAGPLDFHQGGFDHVAPEAFANRNHAPQVMGTRARALALYVVLDDPLPMVADTPVNYRDAPGWDFVVQVPTAWDETRVLAGVPGDLAVIARRRGRDWWIGAITDASARTLTVPLSMLPPGNYRLRSFADKPDSLAIPVQSTVQVTPADRLTLQLAPAGGYAARLQRLDPADEGEATP